MKKVLGKIMMVLSLILIGSILVIFSLDLYVKESVKNKIVTREEVNDLKVDAIIVLGAAIWNNQPSPMLEDRLLEGIALYDKKIASKMIMSGDHRQPNYDEVNQMKSYAILKGVASEDVFMDHAGLSTYDSIYRAKEIFGAKKVVIVSQKYHLYRALYIAKKLGIDAYGVFANPRVYAGQMMRDLREILARNKDFFKCIVKPKSKFLGESISLDNSGDITND